MRFFSSCAVLATSFLLIACSRGAEAASIQGLGFIRGRDSLSFATLGVHLSGWSALTRVRDISAAGLTIVGWGTNPIRRAEASLAVHDASLILVDIDIRPWSRFDFNPINPMSRGVIPIAILGSETFNVLEVDVTTLAFGPNGSASAPGMGGLLVDVNDDGLTDLVTNFQTEESGIAIGNTEACVTGETLYGTPIEGCAVIRTEPACGLGFELVLLLPPLTWLRQRKRRRGA